MIEGSPPINRHAAARYSFLLSVPAVVLSGLFELKDVGEGNGAPAGATAIATLLAFIVGYASIAWLLRFVVHHSIGVFAAYRIAPGSGHPCVRRPSPDAQASRGPCAGCFSEATPRRARDDLPLRRKSAAGDARTALSAYLAWAICCVVRITGISPSPTAAKADQ